MACVYIVGMEGTDFIKIGHTDGAADDRLKALQTGTPFRLKVLKVYPCEHAAFVERAMHRLLSASHHDREWFVLPEMDTLDTVFTEACLLESAAHDLAHSPQQARLKATGHRLLLARRALGLSQQQLAARCGFPYQIINRVEKGHQDLYAQRLALIAQHLGVSADYLLGLKDTCDGS